MHRGSLDHLVRLQRHLRGTTVEALPGESLVRMSQASNRAAQEAGILSSSDLIWGLRIGNLTACDLQTDSCEVCWSH